MPGCLARPNKLSHPQTQHFFLRPGSQLTPQAHKRPHPQTLWETLRSLLPPTPTALAASGGGAPFALHPSRLCRDGGKEPRSRRTDLETERQ